MLLGFTRFCKRNGYFDFMSHKNEKTLLGAHTSIAGGFDNVFGRCQTIGANAAQIFVKNNKQWFAPALPIEEGRKFQKQVEKENLFICGHTGYLINLGAFDGSEVLEKSIESLVQELQRAEILGIPFLVLHPGNHGTTSEEEGLKRIAKNLEQVWKKVGKGCSVRIALENTAGQGTSLGHKFEHLAWLLKNTAHPEHLAVCLDTAHMFAAGYDIRTEKGFEKTFDIIDDLIGLKQVVLIHCNDSKTALSSRVDRHEHLGKGHIGIEAFKALMKSSRLKHVPKILETPKSEDLQEDIENLALLKSF